MTDRHPQGRDMNLNPAGQDMNDAVVGILGRQCPGLGVRLAAVGQPGHGASPGNAPVGAGRTLAEVVAESALVERIWTDRLPVRR